MNRCLDLLEQAAEHLQKLKANVRVAEASATAFLHLAGMAATGWIAARLASNNEHSSAGQWLAACGRFWLADLEAKAAVAHTNVINAAESMEILGSIFGQEL